MKNMLIRCFLFYFISFSAWGYQLTQDFVNGFYWASLPVKFIISENDPVRKSFLKKLSETAIKEWEKETGFSIWDLSLEGSTNIIRWSTNFSSETRMDPESVLAVAIRYTNGPYIAKSEIIINGSHPAFNTPYSSVNNMNLSTTLVHELGHTMGLDHSENELAVMAPNLQYPYNGLHSDDLAGMIDVYEQTEYRQITRYVSPLAYKPEKKSTQPFSCGTTTAQHGGTQGVLSLVSGVVVAFIRRIFMYWKKIFKR